MYKHVRTFIALGTLQGYNDHIHLTLSDKITVRLIKIVTPVTGTITTHTHTFKHTVTLSLHTHTCTNSTHAHTHTDTQIHTQCHTQCVHSHSEVTVATNSVDYVVCQQSSCCYRHHQYLCIVILYMCVCTYNVWSRDFRSSDRVKEVSPNYMKLYSILMIKLIGVASGIKNFCA